MATFERRKLSASTDGKPIAVAATASPGTTIHTAISGTRGFDEVYLWATNTDNAARSVTVEFGGTGIGDRLVDQYSIPGNSNPIPLALGQVLQNGLTIAAFADVASKINISGYVNRIS